MNKYQFVPKSYLHAMHEHLLNPLEDRGFLNESALDGALGNVKTASCYYTHDPSLKFDEAFYFAALYVEKVGNAHAFHQGNKRIAFFCATAFLKKNGFRITPIDKYSSTLMTYYLIAPTSKINISKELFAAWLSCFIFRGKGADKLYQP